MSKEITIGELEYGEVIAFETKKQYCFTPDDEKFKYSNCLLLNISFEKAKLNAKDIKKGMKFIKKSNLCAGATLREYKV